MKPEALAIGQTYFQLTFVDVGLTMPGVKPLVFLGAISLEDGSDAFAFQRTAPYVRYGPNLELRDEQGGIEVFVMPAQEIADLHDVESIAREVTSAAARASLARS